MKTTKLKGGIARLALLTLLWAGTLPLHAQIIETYTFTTNRLLPDGDAAGLMEVRTVNSAIANIASVKVKLHIVGEYNGDLYAYLRHGSGFTVLLNRPGRSPSDSFGYDDNGLDVTFQAGAVNGDIHAYRGSVTPAAGSPLTGIWEPDGRAVDPANVTTGSTRAATLASFNGLNAAGDWTLYLADVDSGATNMLASWELEITGGTYPPLVWSPVDITYGTALGGSQLNATVTYNGTNVSGTFNYSPAAGTVLDSGNGQHLSLTFTPADTASFLPVTTNVTINVAKAPLTLTATDASRTYGTPNPVFTGLFSGVQNGDSLTDTYSCVATPTSPVGAYPIVPAAGGDRLTNYNLTPVNGTLTITAAASSAVLASSANPAPPGASVTFTLTVSAVAPATGTPTGSVQFTIDGSPAGAPVALNNGVAAYATAALTHGTHTVSASYAGDGNFTGSSASLAPDQNINTAPVAGADTIERYALQGVKVRLASLLANDTDADGDTLATTVAGASAHGGVITVIDGWVVYTPAEGYTGADSFTYSLADGHNGTATGTVTVALKVDALPAQNLVATLQGDGTFLIQGSAVPGRTYHLQYSDSLSPANWQNLGSATVTADATGAFSYVDTPPVGTTVRYYRTVYP